MTKRIRDEPAYPGQAQYLRKICERAQELVIEEHARGIAETINEEDRNELLLMGSYDCVELENLADALSLELHTIKKTKQGKKNKQ